MKKSTTKNSLKIPWKLKKKNARHNDRKFDDDSSSPVVERALFVAGRHKRMARGRIPVKASSRALAGTLTTGSVRACPGAPGAAPRWLWPHPGPAGGCACPSAPSAAPTSWTAARNCRCRTWAAESARVERRSATTP